MVYPLIETEKRLWSLADENRLKTGNRKKKTFAFPFIFVQKIRVAGVFKLLLIPSIKTTNMCG
ncbi:hypothetical protein DW091_19590 [Eubacterium sp. AM05-23]|nr:hypothetical protein DW091_19590 [Eubacterium sp. AM05-23]